MFKFKKVFTGFCNECYDVCKNTICTFDRNNILIVARDKKSVKVFDLELKKLARTIKLNNQSACCNWVTCIESQIVLFCDQYINQKTCQFICWIDYNGQVYKTINLPDTICDLDIIENRVYCTFNDVNHVTYTSFSGVTKTCYTSLDLRERCKIAVGDSVIFLLESDRDSVYKVDVNTKQRSVFRKDEIFNPTHIKFDKKTKKLAVTCDEGKCLKIFKT